MINRRNLRTFWRAFALLLVVASQGCGQRAAQFNARGLDLLNRGEAAKAVAAFKDALAIKPNEFALLYNLAVAYHRDGKSDEAIETLKQAIALAPDPTPYEKSLAILQLDGKQYTDSVATFDKLLAAAPSDTTLLLYRGVAKLKNNDLDGATADLDDAISADPYHYRAMMAKASLIRASDPNKALTLLNEAAKIAEDLASAEDKGTIHWNIATLLVEMKLLERAAQHLENARQFLPGDRHVIVTLAGVYQNLGDFDKAQKVYSLLPAGEQGAADSHLFLARLFYNQKQYTFAMTEARKVQEIDKNNIHAINLKGMVFARRDQLILAIREFEESLKIEPNQPDIQQIVEVLKKSR